MRALAPHTERVSTTTRNEMVDVTSRLERYLRKVNVTHGMLIVYVPHTTAAVTINENADPDVRHDMMLKLSELVPQRESYYRHGEGNSDSHVKASLVGNSVTLLVEGGRPVLGRWQGVYFCEFDGPRERDMIVKCVTIDAGE